LQAQGIESRAAELAAGRQRRGVQELLRSVHGAQRNGSATAARAAALEQEVQELLARQAAVDTAVAGEVGRQQELQRSVAELALEAREAVQATSDQQRKADLYVKAGAGKYKCRVAGQMIVFI
jgi:hypothetical protein